MPDSSLTLCDALATTQAPIVVTERAGSRSLRPGMQIGARVMTVAGGHQLSGAIYPFSMFGGRATLEELRVHLAHPGRHEEDNVATIGRTIIKGLLAQYLRPTPLPSFVHSATGEPLVFKTDHYEVLDGAALFAQPDVQGDRERGWDRLVESDDGLTRSLATIVPEAGGKRVSAQYKSRGCCAATRTASRTWRPSRAGARSPTSSSATSSA